MEFLQNIEAERAGHAKGEVVDEHSISEGVSEPTINHCCKKELNKITVQLYETDISQ